MKILTTFRCFAVIGSGQPDLPDEQLLELLRKNRLQVGDMGTPEPIEYGWCGGAHIEDGEFSFQSNVFNDCLLFALRIDTNKVPAETRKAYQLLEETAAAKGNPSGFISKKQKAEARDAVKRKCEDELRSGKHRRSKLVPVLWDLPNQVIYTPASGASMDRFHEIFQRTFRLDLMSKTAGQLARTIIGPRDYEDLKPTRFVPGPGGENHWPDYPWVLKGPEPKDFLGNEFLLWLWYRSEGPQSHTPSPTNSVLLLDKSLDLDCAYGETGKDTLRGVGPGHMPEAFKALQSGKLPRRSGAILDAAGSQYSFTLQGETFQISSLKLPEVDDADTPRTLLEEQITQLRDFTKSMDQLYGVFLKARTSPAWPDEVKRIQEWIQKGGK